jgi:hypothetical protein
LLNHYKFSKTIKNKHFFLFNIILFSAIFLLTNSIQAQDKIIFYPGQATLINTKTKDIDIANGKIIIKKLPIGIDPSTIRILAPHVNSWQYAYDLSSKHSLFLKNIGNKIEIQEKETKKTLTFLNQTENLMLFKDKDKLIINPKGQISIPISDNIALYPKLILDTNSYINKKTQVNINYFLDSIQSYIQYYADYDKQSKKFTLSSFLYTENKSGLDFKHADIEVIAGAPRFLKPTNEYKTRSLQAMSMNSRNNTIEQKDNYYKYVLSQRHTLTNNSLTSFPLFPKKELRATLTYRYSAPIIYYHQNHELASEPVDLILTFKNVSAIPLASGKIQVFSNNEFIGEDILPATSIGYRQSIRYGKAFDVIAKKRLNNVKQISAQERAESYTIYLTNLRANYVKVEVVETIQGKNWKINKSTMPHTKVSANKIKFYMKILPGKSKELSYSIEYTKGQ